MNKKTAIVIVAIMAIAMTMPLVAASPHYDLHRHAQPNQGGSVTAYPMKDWYYHENVTVTAAPATGYAFDHWSGDASGSQTSVIIYMDSVKDVTANFVQTAQYTVTIHVLPASTDGTVTLNPNQQHYYNQYVTLTATANTGYHFDHWSGDIGTANPTDDPISVYVDSSKIINCNFLQDPNTYSLTIAYHPDATTGQVALIPAPNAGSDLYTDGTVVTLTASATDPYNFDHWGGDASGTVSPTTVTMNGNKVVDVYFTLPDPVISSFKAVPTTIAKNGSNVNFSWSTLYADSVTLYIGDVSQGVFPETQNYLTVTLTEATTAYLVATGSGGTTTSEKLTLTGPSDIVPDTNVTDNLPLIIFVILIIVAGGLLLYYREWKKKELLKDTTKFNLDLLKKKKK